MAEKLRGEIAQLKDKIKENNEKLTEIAAKLKDENAEHLAKIKQYEAILSVLPFAQNPEFLAKFDEVIKS